MGIVLVLLIITLALTLFFTHSDSISKGLKYGFVSGLVLEALILLAIIYNCLESYLTIRQFVLERVYEMTDLRSM